MSFNKSFDEEVTFEQARAAFRIGHPQPHKKRVIEKRKKLLESLKRVKK